MAFLKRISGVGGNAGGTGFLRRLRRDAAGNVLAITAAATIPMLAVIGGAVDISRVYVTKSRLQAACDAGVLAGRKAMSTMIYTAAAKTRADSMFAVNFQDTDQGTTGTSFTSSADAEGKVTGTATSTVPMVLMQIFNVSSNTVSTTCSADIQIPNIDVVMVLDVTGSMDQRISGVKKIDSLKDAAIDFYDTLAAALVGNTTSQVRYGLVPYDEAVNGLDVFRNNPTATDFTDRGRLPLSHFVDTMTVQSRVANFNTEAPIYPANSPTNSGGWEVHSSTRTSSQCSSWVNSSAVNGGGPIPSATTRTTYSGNSSGGGYSSSTNWGWSGASVTTGSYRSCRRWRDIETTTYRTEMRYRFTNWTYQPVDYDVRNYKAGSGLTYVSSNSPSGTVELAGSYDLVELAAQGVGSTDIATWNGCIEERETRPATSFAPIPADAWDMNYLVGGTNAQTRWRPALSDLTHDRQRTANRNNTTSNYARPATSCPGARMQNLQVMDRTQFVGHINSLQPGGNTYLDVGMIWGLRLIAPQGMFAARNLTGPNGSQISRHIIFLTDGEPVSATNRYTAYGVERTERRITGTNNINQQATYHSRRFQALCDAQRGAVSIWAIALGTSSTTHMDGCADPGRSFEANDTAQLKNAFRRIAQEVADLRLVE